MQQVLAGENFEVIEHSIVNNGHDTIKLVKHKKQKDEWGVSSTVTMDFYWGHNERSAKRLYSTLVNAWTKKRADKGE